MNQSSRTKLGLFFEPCIEYLNHAFRTCPKVVSLWPPLENKDYVRRMLGLPFFEWLGRHLNNNGSLGDPGAWKEYFVVTVWWIWRWRNEGIFNDKMITVRDKVGTIQRYMKEITTVQMN